MARLNPDIKIKLDTGPLQAALNAYCDGVKRGLIKVTSTPRGKKSFDGYKPPPGSTLVAVDEARDDVVFAQVHGQTLSQGLPTTEELAEIERVSNEATEAVLKLEERTNGRIDEVTSSCALLVRHGYVRCGCGEHAIDPDGDPYAQHREWIDDCAGLETTPGDGAAYSAIDVPPEPVLEGPDLYGSEFELTTEQVRAWHAKNGGAR